MYLIIPSCFTTTMQLAPVLSVIGLRFIRHTTHTAFIEPANLDYISLLYKRHGIAKRFMFRNINRHVVMNVSKRLGVAIPGYGLYLSSKLLLSDRLRVKAELAQGLPESARAFALCYNLDKFDVLLQLIVCTCIANSTLGLGIPLAVGLKPVVDTLAVSCGITSAIFGVYGEYVSNRKLWKSDLPSTG